MPDGGWRSPGLFQERKAFPGETYRISFWVKNERSEFVVRIGGVIPSKGRYGTDVELRGTTDTWQQFEHTYAITEKMNAIRFEMNILQPGTIWIDDIRIEKINGEVE